MSLTDNFFYLLILLVSPGFCQAQIDTLDLQQALSIALEENFSVKVSRNRVLIAENLASPGNAGLLPIVAAEGEYSYSNNDVNIQFAEGLPDQDVQNAASRNLAGSVGINYLLFDGLGTIYSYKALKARSEMTEAETRQAIENIIVQVVDAFYQTALLQESVHIAQEALEISRDRLQRIRLRKQYGTAVGAEVLNAEVDYNTDSVNFLNAKYNLSNARRNLNYLLARDVNAEFFPKIEIQFATGLSLNSLKELTIEKNAGIVAGRFSQTVAKLEYKVAVSDFFPTINVSGAYAYNKSQNEAGFILSNKSVGFTAGAGVSWNIFDGNRSRIQLQNSRIELETSDIQLNQAMLDAERQLYNAWESYQNSLTILQTERRNIRAAEANFMRSEELFELGQINNSQFRDAQLNLIRSRLNIQQALFSAKLAEIELFRISGQLLDTI